MNSSLSSKNSRQKSILILHPHFTIAGGAGTFVLEVSSRLSDLGYKMTICCILAKKELVEKYQEKIEFVEIGGPLSSSLLFWLRLPIFLLKVFKICNQHKPDIIFPQVFPANWWGFIYKLCYPKTKSVWMCQEPSAFIHSKAWINAVNNRLMKTIIKTLNPILRIIDCYLAKHTDYVFANSKYGLKYAREVYNYSAEKSDYVYLGVSDEFRAKDNLKTFQQRQKQIITICRLTKFKNVDLIINAISELQQQGIHDLTLKIVGLGEELENLRKQVRDLKLEKSVIFCGALSLEDMVLEISNSRAFVLASIDEPFGLTVVEAMAAGTPAIVVNSGGPSEIVENNQSGFYFNPKEQVSLIDKIKVLLYDEAQFTALSEGAINRSKAFDWDKTTEKIAKVMNNFNL